MSARRYTMLLPLPALLLAGCANMPTASDSAATQQEAAPVQSEQVAPIPATPTLTEKTDNKTAAQDNQASNDVDAVPETLTPAEQTAYKISLINSYQHWAGTPYEYSGNSSRGIDCSAFTRQVFAGALDVHLPRTTLGQVKLGEKIAKSKLQVGDLIFFKTGVNERHVGIYLGNDQFISSTSSRGVSMSNLKHTYWEKAYWQSRRVVSNEDVITDLQQALAVRTQKVNEKVNRLVVQRIEQEKREERARAAAKRKALAQAKAHHRQEEQNKLLANRKGEAYRKGHVRACYLDYSWAEHTVKSGDSLNKIARDYSVSVAQIKRDNHLSGNVIRLGEVLKIHQSSYPAGFDYTVKSGDSLSAIARHFHTSVSEIKQLNDLDSNQIKVKQSLKMPC